MTKPIALSEFEQLSPAHRVEAVDGLSSQIDAVAEQARATHRFLRFGWFAAALSAYGGQARSYVATRDDVPVAALPLVGMGPSVLGLRAVPGCYWPFRSFPLAEDAGAEAVEPILDRVAQDANAIRLGPVYDNDPALGAMRTAAQARGWVAMDRYIATSFALDMAGMRTEGTWPRNSTLRKNRFHEKHLGAHGELDWSFVCGDDWTPALFDDLASVEKHSWIADRTDGSDAKFTDDGHGAFWRAAASDPVLAKMLWAAVLRIDGKPMAFSFDLNAGVLKYAIANSYDPAVGKHSPGKLLYYRNLVRALDDGMTHVDWGAGDSGYKKVIGAHEGPAIRDWIFVKPGLAGFVAGFLKGRWAKSGN